MKRPSNLWILVLSQALCGSVAPLNTFVAGIIGTRLAPSAKLATLPVALLMVGLALATVPAARWSASTGRRRSFRAGALIAALAALAAATAIRLDSFWLFCASTLALGFNLAFVQQYRFAAAESAAPGGAARAVSFVLLGTLVGAWLGPELAKQSGPLAGFPPHAVAYGLLALVMLLGAGVLSMLQGLGPRERRRDDEPAGRTALQLLARPGILLAVVGAGFGYAIMVFVMTATPVSMHVKDGHSMGHTATVIQSHITAMFLPSVFSGRLIARYGPVKVMVAGIVGVYLCLVVAALGQSVSHYWGSLVLLGVAWNFLFVGATSLLVTQYDEIDKGRAEAVNELSVFSMAAAGSLLSGTVIEWVGWRGLLLVALVPTVLLTIALLLLGPKVRKA